MTILDFWIPCILFVASVFAVGDIETPTAHLKDGPAQTSDAKVKNDHAQWPQEEVYSDHAQLLPEEVKLAHAQCGVPIDDVASALSAAGRGRRVAGGAAATTRAFPWTVLMKRYGHSDARCAAAILSRWWVLTAAHCFDGMAQYEMFLLTGVDNLDTFSMQQRMYHAAALHVHPAYDNVTYANDIALVRVSSPIAFSPATRPVCLPSSNFSLPPGHHCLFAGYGDTLGVPLGRDRKLNGMAVPLVAASVCAAPDWLGDDYGRVQATSLCAGYADGGPDACMGDSGGALVCRQSDGDNYHVYGLSSWGKGCGERRKPGVYTNVAVFADWIRSKIDAFLI